MVIDLGTKKAKEPAKPEQKVVEVKIEPASKPVGETKSSEKEVKFLGFVSFLAHEKELNIITKAKNLKVMAEMLLKDFNGVVPQTFEELEKLPGVGHKTASVVMSQAFGFPAFPVDTHIHRLMKLWKLTEGKNVVQTENDAKKLFAKKDWNKLHLQIIAYGREYSPARGWSLERDFITRMMFEKK